MCNAYFSVGFVIIEDLYGPHILRPQLNYNSIMKQCIEYIQINVCVLVFYESSMLRSNISSDINLA